MISCSPHDRDPHRVVLHRSIQLLVERVEQGIALSVAVAGPIESQERGPAALLEQDELVRIRHVASSRSCSAV